MRRSLRLWPPVFSPCRTLAVVLAVACSWSPCAAEPGADWPYDWRPFWIPGDPVDFHVESFADPWAETSLPAPGLLVALDPVTGLPTAPSEAQRRAAAALLEAELLAPPDTPLPAERILGGGEVVHLQGRFQSFSMARRDAAGRIVIDCASVPGPTASSFAGPPAPQVRREEE